MKLVIFALSLTMVLFCGCGNKNDFDIDISRVSISCGVYPGEDWQLDIDPNVYRADCVIQNSLGLDLSDTIININNTEVPVTQNLDNKQVVFSKSGIGSFHAGDSVKLSIYNSRFSVKDVQLTIPELTAPEFITDPDFPLAGNENSSDTYSISWQPTENVNHYLIGFELYNHEIDYQDQDFFSLLYTGLEIISETSYNLSIDKKYIKNYIYIENFNEEDVLKWLGITLSNVNMIDLIEINEKSCFWATGYKRRLTNIITSDLR